MNRIRATLAQSADRKLLVPFLTAGYPSLEGSLNLIETAIDAGSDMIEIGVPFSDPLADGPEIQHSSQHALERGITMQKIMALAGSVRAKSDIPIILMGYYNPILAAGVEKFLQMCQTAGVDGLIIPDLPVEESAELRVYLRAFDLSAIFLAAPTSPDQRIRLIDRSCGDFVYAVTVAGVTGTGKRFDKTTELYLGHLKQILSKPFVAGFGVSSLESARRLCKYADGVVIGSELIRILKNSRTVKQGQINVGCFLTAVRRGI